MELPGWTESFPSDNKLKIVSVVDGLAKTEEPHINEDQKTLTFGRLPECCVSVNEVSVSRKHCTIVYGKGESNERVPRFWIYDFGSQNRTFINNKMIELKKYHQLKNGDCLRLGSSSRQFVIEYEYDIRDVDIICSDEIRVPTIQNTFSQFDELPKDIEVILDKNKEKEVEIPTVEDPSKLVRRYMEKEGYDFEPKTTKNTFKHLTTYETRLTLPVTDVHDSETNEIEIVVEEDCKNKALKSCYQKAYEYLHKLGLLNETSLETFAARKRRELVENDYYESDDDTFYDRTGEIEKRRLKRIKNMTETEKEDPKKYFKLKTSVDSNLSSKKISSKIEQLNKDIIRFKSQINMVTKKIKSNKEDAIDEYDADAIKMKQTEHKELNFQLSSLTAKLKSAEKEKKIFTERMGIVKENEKLQNTAFKDSKRKENETQSGTVAHPNKRNEAIDSIVKQYNARYETKQMEDHLSEMKNHSEHDNIAKRSFKPTNEGFHIDENSCDTVKFETNYTFNDNENDAKKVNNNRDMVETTNENVVDSSPICWVPPSNQLGDGKSKLNDKYGY